MKAKSLFLALLLVAAGGSLFAQNVLTISPAGVVVAGIDQNGWRNFKLILTQNVTSFSFAGTPPPSQASVSVIFTQNATGGFTVTFASNISNPSTITTTADVTTVCQFNFDGTSNTWIGASGSSSGGGVPTTVTSLFPAGKILAEYQFKPTETCMAAVDYSGNGNNVTGTVGTAPTIIPVTGGCNFTQNGALLTPAALNSAQGITAFLSFQSPGFGGQVHNVPVGGNGNGTTSGCNAIDFSTTPLNNGLDNTVNGTKLINIQNNTIANITMSTWNGTGVVTMSFGTAQGGGLDDDKFWINGVRPPFISLQQFI